MTSTSIETFAIRDGLLALTGRFPIPAVDLFARFRSDWGSCCERRLWRALRWLEERGKIRRIGKRSRSEGYVRSPVEVVSADEAERRRRLDLHDRGCCYDCERKRRRRSDPKWFRVLQSGYCLACYSVRADQRRKLCAERKAA